MPLRRPFSGKQQGGSFNDFLLRPMRNTLREHCLQFTEFVFGRLSIKKHFFIQIVFVFGNFSCKNFIMDPNIQVSKMSSVSDDNNNKSFLDQFVLMVNHDEVEQIDNVQKNMFVFDKINRIV